MLSKLRKGLKNHISTLDIRFGSWIKRSNLYLYPGQPDLLESDLHGSPCKKISPPNGFFFRRCFTRTFVALLFAYHVRITTGKAWSWNPWNWNGSAFHAALKVAMVLKVRFWKLFAIENCQSWLIYGKWWWIPVRKLLVHQRYISLRTKERVLLWYFYL